MSRSSKYYDEYYDYVLKGIEPSSKTKKAVFNIIHDLTDRRGIGQEFEQLDDDIQDEIIEKWINQIDNAIA